MYDRCGYLFVELHGSRCDSCGGVVLRVMMVAQHTADMCRTASI